MSEETCELCGKTHGEHFWGHCKVTEGKLSSEKFVLDKDYNERPPWLDKFSEEEWQTIHSVAGQLARYIFRLEARVKAEQC